MSNSISSITERSCWGEGGLWNFGKSWYLEQSVNFGRNDMISFSLNAEICFTVSTITLNVATWHFHGNVSYKLNTHLSKHCCGVNDPQQSGSCGGGAYLLACESLPSLLSGAPCPVTLLFSIPFPVLGGCWIKRQPGLWLIYRWPSYTG